MSDIAEYMRQGGPCIELNERCKVMDAASGCACAKAAAEIERLRGALRLVRQQCPDKKPPPAFDQWGDMIADNAERHAERVSAEDRWGIAEIVDAALEERT